MIVYSGAELALGATSFWEVSGYGGAWAKAFGDRDTGSPPVPGKSAYIWLHVVLSIRHDVPPLSLPP